MPDPNRRDFVRSLALAAPAAAIATSAAPGADDEKEKKDEPAKGESPKEKPKTEADARMELILARYGKLLDEAARKSIRAEIEGHVRRAEALRKIPLDNGDGPFPVFHPYR